MGKGDTVEEELKVADRYLTEREERRKAMLHDIAEILEAAFDA